MGLFDFFKKNEGQKEQKEQKEQKAVDFDEIKAFSLHAVELAIPEIESTDSFLPFGGVLTTDNTFQMIVYHDPEKTTIDHREHATIIQNIVKERYAEPKNMLFFMAWDGIAHLSTGDIDCINVKVDNKFLDTHRIFTYTYKKINGKVELVNNENPMIKDL